MEKCNYGHKCNINYTQTNRKMRLYIDQSHVQLYTLGVKVRNTKMDLNIYGTWRPLQADLLYRRPNNLNTKNIWLLLRLKLCIWVRRTQFKAKNVKKVCIKKIRVIFFCADGIRTHDQQNSELLVDWSSSYRGHDLVSKFKK